MSTRLGFIGIGLMGERMCRRLHEAGLALTIYNRSPEKTASLAELGVSVASSVAELSAAADVILLCLSDTAAVESVVFGSGEDALYAHLREGQSIIDLSSIAPLRSSEFAHRVSDVGVDWVDAPVSGGTAGAESGTLVVMAGGAETVVDRVRPIFEPLASRVTRVGDAGAGQMAKLCNQMVVACTAAVIAEMVGMARKTGIDPSLLPQALAGGFADSKPFQILVPQMAADDFTLKWKVATLRKDLALASELSREIDCELPMCTEALSVLGAHAEKGYADKDLSTLVLAYQQA